MKQGDATARAARLAAGRPCATSPRRPAFSIATVSRVLNGQANVARRPASWSGRPCRLGDRPPARARPGARSQRRLRALPQPPHRHFGLIVSSVAETLELHGRPAAPQYRGGRPGGHGPRRPPGPSRHRGAILVLPPEPGEPHGALRRAGSRSSRWTQDTDAKRHRRGVGGALPARAKSKLRRRARHRRVGVIAGPPDWLASEASLAGTRSALGRTGDPPSRAGPRRGTQHRVRLPGGRGAARPAPAADGPGRVQRQDGRRRDQGGGRARPRVPTTFRRGFDDSTSAGRPARC